VSYCQHFKRGGRPLEYHLAAEANPVCYNVQAMNEHDQYEAWIAELYDALRDNMPDAAGQARGKTGDFEKVGFHVGADYGAAGQNGGVIVAITLMDPERSGRGTHKQVAADWRRDDPNEVARDAIAAYVKLREQYP
jgi:hypothetical protein